MSAILHGYPSNPRTTPPTGTPGRRVLCADAWTLEILDAPGAWLVPLPPGEQTVAIIDTGMRPDHQDLLPTRSETEIALDTSGEENGHGTKVAGIIAAAHGTGHGRAGVCPGARILPFKVGTMMLLWDLSLAQLGFTFDMMAERIAEAIRILNEEFRQHRYRILNISKSGQLEAATAEDLARKYLLPAVEIFLGAGGVLLVGGDNTAQVPAASCFPAAVKRVVSRPRSVLVVGSVLDNGNLWGGELEALYSGQSDVDVYAPGSKQEVLDFLNPRGYTTDAGNSYAIPHVAGVAALLLRIDPGLGGEAVADAIRESAEVQRTDNQGETIRVVNAFAAALAAHNRCHPEQPLAGYRVSMPVEFNEGTLEVDGEPVAVSSTANFIPAFCRFVAPKEADVFARLFQHPSLATGGARSCFWEGKLRELVDLGMPSSRASGWSHPAVEELRTVRLQGLATRVCRDDAGNAPLADARVTLSDRRRAGRWSARTDTEGRFVVPFGEPGPYALTVEETAPGSSRWEIELALQGNTIYADDPNHPGTPYIALGEPLPRSLWLAGWAGWVRVEGAYRRQGDDLDGARGTLRIEARSRALIREIFLHHCFHQVTGDSLDFETVLAGGEGWEKGQGWKPMTAEECADELADQMPDLDSREIRVCSSLHGDLAGGFDSTWRNDYQYRFDSGEWYGDQEVPPGVVIAQGAGDCGFALDLGQLTSRVLEAHFRAGGGASFPYTVDLDFGFFADHSAAQGAGVRIGLEELGGRITVAAVECEIDRYLTPDRRRLRVVAGPSSSALRFLKHPASPLVLEPDPEPAPAGCISTVCAIPSAEDGLPDSLGEIFAVGAQGEIGRVRVA